ncbi:MAG: SGNH/GDSL hydrolase family protein [Patescibacteria group bacterium]
MKRLLYLSFVVVVCAASLSVARAQTADINSNAPAWSRPNAKALRRVSSVDSAQHEPNFLSNLDCSLADYRLADSDQMQTGCFTPTAFGLLDSDSDTVIFNGTDEGLPLLPYSAHQVLAPWPQALNLVALEAVNTGGSYISLYKNPLASLKDRRDLLLRLTGRQLTAAPELHLKDPSGKQLIINPQTIAFSDGGEWLVAETLGGSFVRINLATLDMTAFAPAFGSQSSSALLKSRVAISSDGHYVAIYNQVAESFKVHDLTTCSDEVANLKPRNCEAYDYFPFVRQQIAGLQSVRHVRFVNPSLLSFETQTSNSAGSGIYELAPTDSIDSLIDYLALGDSYTSGEGAFDYLAGTDTDTNMCHLSIHSYPVLLTRDLFSSIGSHTVACSGAVINDIGNNNQAYRGQVSGVASFDELRRNQATLLNSIMANYAPGYVAQQRFVQQYQPRIVTVAVGGNDIGFGNILQNCVTPRFSPKLSASNCYNTYEDRLELLKLVDKTKPRWTALYKQLLSQAPGVRLYVIGYPQIAYSRGSCALNVHLSQSELELAEELIDYLNDSIEEAAAKASVSYIDISQAFAGHRLCETASHNVALNGVTAGKDGKLLGLKVFGKESYHPNKFGHALMEQAILRQSRNFTVTASVSSPKDNGQALLKAPKTGRKISNIIPATNITSQVVKRGHTASIKVSGVTAGLKAKTSYEVRLDGINGAVIGRVISDDIGDIDASIEMPAASVSGGHTIDIIGENQLGESTDVSQPIYVPASDNDADSDGQTDTVDSCPSAANSDQDTDQDNVDDVCDSFIDQAPPGFGSSSGSTASGSNLVIKPLNPAAIINTKVSLPDGLGVSAINPTLVPRQSFKPVITSKDPNPRDAVARLPIINVLRWGGLLIIAWFLILLASMLVRLIINKRLGLGYV